MSYILEALKKSEQERERERGALPDIKSVHSPSPAMYTGERSWWPFILIAIVVLAAAALTVIYVTKRNPLSEQTVVEQPSASAKKEKQVAVAPVEQALKQTVKQASDAEASGPKATSKSSSTDTEQKKQSVVFSKQPLEHDDVIGNLNEQREKAAASKMQQVAPGSIKRDVAVAISEIPDSVRKRIPNIAFEGHVYSSVPERRSIMINGHKRREGDTIGDGLLVREITGEGAEFEFQGYRFRLNALQDWSSK